MTSINLLPWREEKKLRRQTRFYIQVVITLLVSIVCLWSISEFLSHSLERQQEKNSYLNDEINQLNNKIKRLKTLKENKRDLVKQIQLIEQLQQARYLPSQLLAALTHIIVPGVYLERVKKHGNHLWIEGVTESNNQLATMLRNFEASHWFNKILVQKVNLKTGRMQLPHKFSLRVDINVAGLEGSK